MPITNDHDNNQHPPARPRVGSRAKLGLAATLLFALGIGAGAVVMAQTRPPVAMAPITPVAIRTLPSDGIVTIRGRVAEIFGNKVIVADATGRALVDLGREGDNHALVTANEPVTVQGRFDRGSVHAAFLIGPDNKVVALGPLGGPHHPPHGHPGEDEGPDGPPPPSGAGRTVAPSVPAAGAAAPVAVPTAN